MNAGILLFGTIGLTGLVVAAVGMVLVLRSRNAGTPVIAEVVAHRSYASHGRAMYYPEYRAVLADGRQVTGVGATASTWRSPNVGARVALVYRAGDADSPLVERTEAVTFIAGASLLALGALLFVGGVALTIAAA